MFMSEEAEQMTMFSEFFLDKELEKAIPRYVDNIRYVVDMKSRDQIKRRARLIGRAYISPFHFTEPLHFIEDQLSPSSYPSRGDNFKADFAPFFSFDLGLNPVVGAGAAGEWDDFSLNHPRLLDWGEWLIFYYNGNDTALPSLGQFQIGEGYTESFTSVIKGIFKRDEKGWNLLKKLIGEEKLKEFKSGHPLHFLGDRGGNLYIYNNRNIRYAENLNTQEKIHEGKLLSCGYCTGDSIVALIVTFLNGEDNFSNRWKCGILEVDDNLLNYLPFMSTAPAI